MKLDEIVRLVADILQAFDAERPVHRAFQPGIGPFGEPQLIKALAERMASQGIDAHTQRQPDLRISQEWALEFKIVRPFGDNGKEAENWSVNMLHPYAGNVSLLSDALKLQALTTYAKKGLVVIGFEHEPPKIRLDPLLDSFEAVAHHVLSIQLEPRIEQKRSPLVHPEHQVLRCVAWEMRTVGPPGGI